MDLFDDTQKRLATSCGLKTVFFSSQENLTSDHQSRDFLPNPWFRPIVSPVKQGACIKKLVNMWEFTNFVKTLLDVTWFHYEMWPPKPVSYILLVGGSNLTNMSQNGFKSSPILGVKIRNIWNHPVCCFSQAPDLAFPFMLSEPAVKIGKTTAYIIFLQPVTDIVKAHGNHNSEHQRWDQTQIGALVHHIPVASKWKK